jgi:tetratricopeptide (TPR) repeat protein
VRHAGHRPRAEAALVLLLFALPGCAGELAAFAALAFGMTIGALLLGRDRQRRALEQAETIRYAIGTGQHRMIEEQLRKELALAEAGEAVSPERQWLGRLHLGGLLVAEWRLDEAREVYGEADESVSPLLQGLSAFGRHELAVLTETPDEERLRRIHSDRDRCLQHVPRHHHEAMSMTWGALEGLCLVRMGRAREAIPLLERGLKSLDLEYSPARVVYLFHLGQAYEHVGERQLAGARYEEATIAFPGTRLASEARARHTALGPGPSDGLFRKMLPEPPVAAPGTVPESADRAETDRRPPTQGDDDEKA